MKVQGVLGYVDDSNCVGDLYHSKGGGQMKRVGASTLDRCSSVEFNFLFSASDCSLYHVGVLIVAVRPRAEALPSAVMQSNNRNVVLRSSIYFLVPLNTLQLFLYNNSIEGGELCSRFRPDNTSR